MLWSFFRLWSFHGQQLPKSAATRHFCIPMVKERSKEILRGCSNLREDQYARNGQRGTLATLLNSSWSSLWSAPFSPSLSSRGTGAGPHPSFLPGRRRKTKARMGPGRPSVGCQGKVSIKAMRASASRCLTGGLSRADSRSAGCFPGWLTGACCPRHPRLPTAEAGHRQPRGVPRPAPRDALDHGNYLDLGLKQATASLGADGSGAAGPGWDGTGRSWVLLK